MQCLKCRNVNICLNVKCRQWNSITKLHGDQFPKPSRLCSKALTLDGFKLTVNNYSWTHSHKQFNLLILTLQLHNMSCFTHSSTFWLFIQELCWFRSFNCCCSVTVFSDFDLCLFIRCLQWKTVQNLFKMKNNNPINLSFTNMQLCEKLHSWSFWTAG